MLLQRPARHLLPISPSSTRASFSSTLCCEGAEQPPFLVVLCRRNVTFCFSWGHSVCCIVCDVPWICIIRVRINVFCFVSFFLLLFFSFLFYSFVDLVMILNFKGNMDFIKSHPHYGKHYSHFYHRNMSIYLSSHRTDNPPRHDTSTKDVPYK